ncbi:MAG: glycosyltransferase family 2 protein [Nodosilinea sp.]
MFLIFRRPDLTVQVFEAIRQAKPTKLLVVADGPRNAEEAVLCKQARAVTENIDWDCEVIRNYSDINLGCRDRVSSGLTWAFEQVEEAIILEDDCLPHPSFFRYCETLLEYYRDDERLMVISGDNFQNGRQRMPYSYYFSKYNHCWGWATWRRAWQHWEFNPQKWVEFRDSGLVRSLCHESHEEKYWTDIFDMLFLENKINAWGYVWMFACWSQGGLTALPHVNLVSNIGFGLDSTHTGGKSKLANMPTKEIGNIKHPSFVLRCVEEDCYTFKNIFRQKLFKKIYTSMYKLKLNITHFKQVLKHI